MSVQATNYDGTRTYTLAETSDVTPPVKLVVNPDFKVWQRGEKLTLTANQYGCDMWRVSGNCTIQKVANGLKIVSGTNITLRQYVEGNYGGKSLTQCHSVNGSRVVKTFTHSSGRIVLEIKNLNAGDIVNYCDLFLGSVAFPHFEEDVAESFVKCRRYLVVYQGLYTMVPAIGIKVSATQIEIPVDLSCLKESGTITHGTLGVRDPYSSAVISTPTLSMKSRFQIVVKASSAISAVSQNYPVAITLEDSTPFCISCEPL